MAAHLQPVLAGIVAWLRAGYPDGVPETDYLPLFALLSRRLSDNEVREIADALVDDGDLPIEKADIGTWITKHTHESPSEADIARVRRKLQAAGRPVADPEDQ